MTEFKLGIIENVVQKEACFTVLWLTSAPLSLGPTVMSEAHKLTKIRQDHSSLHQDFLFKALYLRYDSELNLRW